MSNGTSTTTSSSCSVDPAAAAGSALVVGGNGGASGLFFFFRSSMSLTRFVAVAVPTTSKPHRSRCAILETTSTSSARNSMAFDSWYSAPQISSGVIDVSPSVNLESRYSAPAPSTISLSTLPLPPQPWSWIDASGLRSKSSTQPRTTRFIRLSICASPRCTALKSRCAVPSEDTLDDAAPPPRPIRYAGPPILATSMPSAQSSLNAWAASSQPSPAENMTGLIHSSRSAIASRPRNDRQYPATTGSPNLLP
mmetsp:Transcript_630/g.2493  ORF Transcript_630/g.2493 Transcript_630/m.2493 type:complete len:252 (+) Transcript_630:3509-4264(+)